MSSEHEKLDLNLDAREFLKQRIKERPSDKCLGYHGTSFQTLKYLVQHGTLPGFTDPQAGALTQNIQTGDLFYFPCLEATNENPFYEASQYAHLIASSHFLLEKLGLNLGDRKLNALTGSVIDFGSKADIEELKRIITKDANFKKLTKMAKLQKGFVLELDKRIKNFYKLVDCSKNDDGWKIVTKSGLPISYVKAVIPLGNLERKLLSKL